MGDPADFVFCEHIIHSQQTSEAIIKFLLIHGLFNWVSLMNIKEAKKIINK